MSYDPGKIDGPAKQLQDPFDAQAPDHWMPPADLAGVMQTRTYRGFSVYKSAPYGLWRCHERTDGKQLPKALQDNAFTGINVCFQFIDDVLRKEADQK